MAASPTNLWATQFVQYVNLHFFPPNIAQEKVSDIF